MIISEGVGEIELPPWKEEVCEISGIGGILS